jgi:hypothetical protein
MWVFRLEHAGIFIGKWRATVSRMIPRRSIALAFGLMPGLAAVLVAIATPASAMDGGVPDSRPATPAGEITAQYWHGLNRDPDAGGLANYLTFVNQNCRWGILDGSFKILNSAEAGNVWHNNSQTLAGMLYAALLNRPPDAGGLATYSNAISQRGLRWATASMMGSPEYNGRLNRICTNPNETATMYTPAAAQAFVRNVLINNAENLAETCAMDTAVRTALGSLKSVPWPPAQALGRIATVTNMVITGYGLDGTCGAVVTYLRAAYQVNSVIGGGQDNPVFMQWSVGSPDWLTGQRPFTIRVGPNPTSWNGFSGKAW